MKKLLYRVEIFKQDFYFSIKLGCDFFLPWAPWEIELETQELLPYKVVTIHDFYKKQL